MLIYPIPMIVALFGEPEDISQSSSSSIASWLTKKKHLRRKLGIMSRDKQVAESKDVYITTKARKTCKIQTEKSKRPFSNLLRNDGFMADAVLFNKVNRSAEDYKFCCEQEVDIEHVVQTVVNRDPARFFLWC
ncbi:hypothetical protein PHYBLDRAFT_174313 [Phycomyces blakesleeanus NRRL 1555(-)]|uniref:Uncharacterized protein n=1 Tax=Phycomyces blakesleeanus (strain ATCC 8743b / DSM 1359 / FGSC 10004 / NBRC 33097 / NRRL 1555) TaxID=763407 RepID=A0A162WI30_PHYB8|nr:hypothetical protein PHYBLDRAFT_174313 [Phycomyces blakesleeanus NRRL 1555(-)]OAD67275.1 hypothetical protein PHYBLDRAFT_174313 [Phycomyces blakesleeanus NRRL 1555(-)]|eukprot:XP_018285315.1 hypothetical protein PHYBLDRAFT_174313 [Phycomyces blakesleeanus NRRL 1555(-)]